jgi:hypothetical protein
VLKPEDGRKGTKMQSEAGRQKCPEKGTILGEAENGRGRLVGAKRFAAFAT